MSLLGFCLASFAMLGHGLLSLGLSLLGFAWVRLGLLVCVCLKVCVCVLQLAGACLELLKLAEIAWSCLRLAWARLGSPGLA